MINNYFCVCYGRSEIVPISSLLLQSAFRYFDITSSTNLKIKTTQCNIFYNYFLFHFLILPRLTCETHKTLYFQHLLNFCLNFTPTLF